jgi:hypothetical protein
MSLAYRNLIRESEEELLGPEKRHRSTHLSHRLRMLRLLKSGTSESIQQAADVLGYSGLKEETKKEIGPDGETKEKKPARVFSFDEARFGLIDWHRRCY